MFYYVPYCCPAPYYVHVPINSYRALPFDGTDSNVNPQIWEQRVKKQTPIRDYGPEPFVVDIEEVTKQNNTFRTDLWTGNHFQVTLMSLNVGEDIGLEIHPNVDQFLRLEQGQGIVRMGKSRDNLSFVRRIKDNSAIMVPAGTWHNVINTGNVPLKLYSIYAPPQHPRGTVQKTKAEAMKAE